MNTTRKKAPYRKSQRFNIASFRNSLTDRWLQLKEIILQKSKQTTKDYFQSSTINCYPYIVDDTLEKWERWMWWTVHGVAAVVAAWVMWTAGSEAILNPVVVTRVPVGAPLSSVPHPAVAICTLNRISKWRATDLAKSLIAMNKSTEYELEELINLLGILGHAYDLELPNSRELEILHSILIPYSMEFIMRNLTPSCEETLKRCLWRNEAINCMKLFSLRKTMDGYCCTFNYIRQTDFFLSNFSTDDTLMALPGMERGLSIVMDPQLDDYLYTRLPHEGAKVFIFNPEDYPDVSSGSCSQLSVSPRTELYINLDAVYISGSEAVEKLKPSIRGCLFDSDIKGFKESYSNCMVNCRIRNIRKTCGCIPFFLPSQTDEDICVLTDILCLNKWKDTWRMAFSENILSEDGQIPAGSSGPPCSSCLPPCTEATFRAKQYSLPLQPSSVNGQPDSEKAILKKGVYFRDHSVIHIFFSKDTVIHLVHNVISSWYDLLSSMGGLCGLVLGASLISAAEFLYFLFGGPVLRPRRRFQTEMRQLYWEELRNYKR